MYLLRMSSILIGLAFLLSTSSFAQTNNQSKQPTSFKSGPLEILPLKATLAIKPLNGEVLIKPTINLRIKNISASQVNIILFQRSLTATDNLGDDVFGQASPISSGVTLSQQRQFTEAFRVESNQFTSLYPDQYLDSQITCKDCRIQPDMNGSYFRSHNPNTISVTGTIGLMNQDGTTKLIPLSFTDIPLLVVK